MNDKYFYLCILFCTLDVSYGVVDTVDDSTQVCREVGNPGAKNASIRIQSDALLIARSVMCEPLKELVTKKNITLSYFDGKSYDELANAYGTSNEETYYLLQEIVSRRVGVPNVSPDVIFADAYWVDPISDYLLPLDSIDYSDIQEQWIRKRNEKVISLTALSGRHCLFYRKDLFDYHGLQIPTDIETFEKTLLTIQDKEREIRGDSSFHGLLLAPGNDPNRITYTLATLLSTESAGGIVESNGNISINNPNAIKVLDRWRGWFKTIVPIQAFGWSTSDAIDAFLEGKGAAVLAWSRASLVMNKKNAESTSWEIAVGPIPGKEGAGCSGDWSIAIPKNTNQKDAALAFVHMFAQNSWRHALGARDTEPYTNSLLDEKDKWSQYCEINTILCNSYRRYPDFWQRLSHRPSAGCGEYYIQCSRIIYKHVHSFLQSDSVSAEDVVRSLESDLEVLLGMRLPMLIINEDFKDFHTLKNVSVVLGSLITAGLCGYILYKISKINHVKKKTIPLPFLTGLTTMVFTAALGAAILTSCVVQMNKTSDRMTRDIRVRTLQGLEEVINIQFALLRGGRTSLDIMSNVVSQAKQTFGKLEIHAQSLIVLIDKETDITLISSDPSKQSMNVPYTHPWISEALSKLDYKHSLIDNTQTLRFEHHGQVILVNQRGVEVSPEKEFRGAQWVLLYLTPEEVVLGEADKMRTAAMNIGISFAVAAVVMTVLITSYLSSPFNQLALKMEKIQKLQFEAIGDTDSSSWVTEVRILQVNLRKMQKLLKEYTKFLPPAFIDSLQEEETTGPYTPPVFSESQKDSKCAIVVTGISDESSLWETLRTKDMKQAIKIHDDIIKAAITETKGYQVRHIGNSFMLSFKTANAAVNFFNIVTKNFEKNKHWPEALMGHNGEYHRGLAVDGHVYNGLMLQLGMSFGNITQETSVLTDAVDLSGPAVLLAATMQSTAFGGSAATTSELLAEVAMNDLETPLSLPCGQLKVKDVPQPVEVFLIFPASARTRLEVVEQQILKKYPQQSRLNPLIATTPNLPLHVSCVSSSVLASSSYSLSENLTQVSQCTIAVAQADFSNFGSEVEPLAEIQTFMSMAVGASERCGGVVFSVCSSSLSTAWNTTRSAPAHVSSGLLYTGLLYNFCQKSSIWSKRVTIGVASGSAVYGNVGSDSHRFSVIIGSVVETAGVLTSEAKALGAFAVYLALSGQPDPTADSFVEPFLRPVDTFRSSQESLLVHQIRCECLSQGIFETKTCTNWGWSAEYKTAFLQKDIHSILQHSESDPVLQRVVDLLTQNQ